MYFITSYLNTFGTSFCNSFEFNRKITIRFKCIISVYYLKVFTKGTINLNLCGFKFCVLTSSKA